MTGWVGEVLLCTKFHQGPMIALWGLEAGSSVFWEVEVVTSETFDSDCVLISSKRVFIWNVFDGFTEKYGYVIVSIPHFLVIIRQYLA